MIRPFEVPPRTNDAGNDLVVILAYRVVLDFDTRDMHFAKTVDPDRPLMSMFSCQTVITKQVVVGCNRDMSNGFNKIVCDHPLIFKRWMR